ncbi:MAG: hypothetical protein R3C14_54290 [Caldilineaceae bacterium]
MRSLRIALVVIALAVLASAFFVYNNPSQASALFFQLGKIGMSNEEVCNIELRNYVRDTVRPILIEWDDAVTLATNSSRMTLAPQIAALQAIRRKVQSDEKSFCTLVLTSSIQTMMDSVINGFVAFLGNEDDSVVERHFTGASRMMDDIKRQLDEIGTGK